MKHTPISRARPAVNGREHARVGHRRGVTLALQIEFGVVDTARDIGREDHLEIDIGAPRLPDKGKANKKRNRDEGGSHRTFSYPVLLG